MKLLDITIILAYFLGVAVIGLLSSRKSQKNSRSYFLGGENIGWLAVGASLFASNISAEHFIGLAGSGAASGLAVGQFELLACFILLLLGWFFAPFYLKNFIFTMPEFLEKRFNPQCRYYLSIISLVAYIFTKISVCIYAGAIVLQSVLGWNMWVSAIVLVVATGIFTTTGGLRAVIYMDFFQAGVLILGALLVTVISINHLGGLSELVINTKPSFFSTWHSFNHPDFPWTGIIFGAPILGVWYWCTDQMIVQRTLASKNVNDARKSTIFAGYLKILPLFILVLPGISGGILFPDVEPNKVYITLVQNLLPPGVKGLVVAALLAAVMSSLSSVFNSSSTLVVIDFYKKIRPQAKEKELVRAGQLVTLVLLVVGLLWLPFIGIMSNQLFVYLQSVQAYISPPIAAVFILGLLHKRINGKGAFSALIVGFIMGAIRFITEIMSKSGMLDNKILTWYANINFLHFAILLFVVSAIVMTVVSYTSGEPTKKSLIVFDKIHEKTKAGISINTFWIKASSYILVGLVILIWFYFSPLFF